VVCRTCAAQKSLESACITPVLQLLKFPRSQRSYGQTGMARSTWLVILIKNIYTLWGQKRFLLPVTYFPTSLVYPCTPRVTGIKRVGITKKHLLRHFWAIQRKCLLGTVNSWYKAVPVNKSYL